MEKIKQMLSPSHSKDDKVPHSDTHPSDVAAHGDPSAGTTGTPLPASAVKDTGPSPSAATSGTESSRPGTSAIASPLSASGADANASTLGIKSGIVGGSPSAPSNFHSPEHASATTGATGNFSKRDLPDRTATSGLGSANVLQSSTERSFPLGSGNTAGQSHLGRDSAIVGGAGTREQSDPSVMSPLGTHEHKGHGHEFVGDPCPSGDEPKVDGYPHHIPGPHGTDTANRLDPHIPGEFPTESGEDIHSVSNNTTSSSQLGGSTVAAGTAGIAGATALGTQHEKSVHDSVHEPPFTGLGSYEDQRFDPAAAGTARIAGATALGTQHEKSVHDSVHEPPSTGLGTQHEKSVHDSVHEPPLTGLGSYEDQRFDPAAAQAHKSSQLGSIGYPSSNSVPPGTATSTDQSHLGRDAAIGCAAAIGTYEVGKDHRSGPTSTAYQEGSGLVSPTKSNQPDSHHHGRNAAVAGGAGAAGLAGYEATKKDHLDPTQGARQPLATPTEAPMDARIFDQTQRVPEERQTEGGWAADTKAQEKLEKAREKEAEKAHDRADKENKQHAKEVEKAHDKAAAKEGDKGEKKHGLLGFLHRDKQDTPEEKGIKEQGSLREADQVAHTRHQRELEAAAGAGTVGVAGASFEPSLREQEEHADGSSAQRVSTDEKGHHKLHKEPPAKVQRELDQRSQEAGSFGNSSVGGSSRDGIVTEPHTGLPMNVGKYGSGSGGTDGSSTIPGYHQD